MAKYLKEILQGTSNPSKNYNFDFHILDFVHEILYVTLLT